MWQSFWNWLLGLFGWKPSKGVLPDKAKDVAKPRPGTKVVEPALKEKARAWYYQPEMIHLLDEIAKFEAGKAGYNADYRNDDRWNLEKYNLDQVIALAKSQVSSGEASSAIGRYQFLSKTLQSLKTSLKLSGKEQFTILFQDDLAIALMIRRGLMDFLRNKLSLEDFCNNLAKEWASLPVVTDVERRSGKKVWTVKKGRSYYAGDGLNKSFHSPESVLKTVQSMALALRPAMPR